MYNFMTQVSHFTFYKNKTSKQIKKEKYCEQFRDTGEPWYVGNTLSSASSSYHLPHIPIAKQNKQKMKIKTLQRLMKNL